MDIKKDSPFTDITKYSTKKLFAMIQVRQYENRRRRKFVATCPFCLRNEMAYVDRDSGEAERLAKSKVLNHIVSHHSEMVDREQDA